ncbi:hypothetical protein TWF506_001712 [Arthrobotrys conoides]|uniref:Uncharacterized protein n=1 Tax=Arthrobotrys conoides TaxID=74498 RepID=A0AAN8NP03_9PEZI
MQNSYQQTPYNGKQSYTAVPPAGPEPPQYAGTDVEKAAPADFNPTPNFHRSLTKDSIYLPLIKRRVAKKKFWIIVGVVAGVVIIAIIVGVAVGVSKSKSNNKSRGKNAQGAKGGKSGSGGKGGFSSGDGEDDGGDDTGNPDGGSSSTDPCQQLVDIGAPWPDISDCLHQQHLTRLEIIDNFDGSNDYKTYTYNPYASAGSTDKPAGNAKSINHDGGKAPKQPKIDDKARGKLNNKDHGKLDGKKSPKPNPNKVPGKSNEKTHGNPDDRKNPEPDSTKVPGKSNEKSPGGSDDRKAPKPNPNKVPGKSNEKAHGSPDEKNLPKPVTLPGKSNEKAHGGSDKKSLNKPGVKTRSIDIKIGSLIEMAYKDLGQN